MADKITPDTQVSTAELACVLGLTDRAVRKIAGTGKLEKISKGRFALCGCVQQYIKTLCKKPETVEDAELEKKKKMAEVTLKTAKANIAEMEVEELRGKMHRSEDVAAMTEDLIYTIRGALMALPGRLAIDTAAAKTPAEAADIIRKEVSFIMRNLAEYRYDPKKYEERVRKRMDWDAEAEDSDDG